MLKAREYEDLFTEVILNNCKWVFLVRSAGLVWICSGLSWLFKKVLTSLEGRTFKPPHGLLPTFLWPSQGVAVSAPGWPTCGALCLTLLGSSGAFWSVLLCPPLRILSILLGSLRSWCLCSYLDVQKYLNPNSFFYPHSSDKTRKYTY